MLPNPSTPSNKVEFSTYPWNDDAVNMDFSTDSAGVILSGASGMLGSALTLALNNRQTPVLQLVRRRPSGERQLQWSPEVDPAVSNPAPLEGAAAAIHLSGASVAAHRWTEAYKRELATSRLDSTRRLAKVLAALRNPPRSFLVASAIGIYGDRGDELLTESSAAGKGFLAELCEQWEAAADPAVQAGIRVVHLRFGVVLGPGKGALQQMLPPFRIGLGARLGSGKQWMSWVALADVVAAILFALDHRELSGAVNVVSPNPVTNADFTQALGRELHRPAILTVPRFALRVLFGQMADEALLASARVQPAKLQAAGYQFLLPEIDGALKAALS
jgi:uncharacterized protein (TIGR01777 family)